MRLGAPRRRAGYRERVATAKMARRSRGQCDAGGARPGSKAIPADRQEQGDDDEGADGLLSRRDLTGIVAHLVAHRRTRQVGDWVSVLVGAAGFEPATPRL
jgi:hypothetical protein